MARRIALVAGGVRVVAELLDAEAPRISQRCWESLPVDGFAVHAKFAGDELIVMLPFYADPENEILEVQPGDIGYYPGRQTLCLFYGSTRPFGKVSVFARVVEGLEPIASVGQRALREGLLAARIERADGSERAPGPGAATVETAGVGVATAAILAELRAFTRAVWAAEPPDLAALRQMARPPMGNRPCVFYAGFNLFWLGEELQVARQLALASEVPLAPLGRALAAQIDRHAARLAKWEMADTVGLMERLSGYLRDGGPGSPAEFAAVVEAALLAFDRVQSWVDAMLPWSDLESALALRHPLTPPQGSSGALRPLPLGESGERE